MNTSLLLLPLIFFSCSSGDVSQPTERKITSNSVPSANLTCNYPNFKTTSRSLYKQYQLDQSIENKKLLLEQLRDSLFACWLGTPWDFNGTTEEPNNGKIACGYFVTTLLRDIGIKVNRIQHAQCASEEMIKTVCLKNSIKRYSNQSISIFNEKVKNLGAGLYVVGLDFHTGFILNDGEEIYFIHASNAGKKVVEKEIALESTVLASSNYKVIGKVI